MDKVEIMHTSFGIAQRFKTFWKGIEEDVSNIFHIYIKWRLLVFVLGMLPSDGLSKEKLYLLGTLVLVATTMITLSWYKGLWRE